MKSLHRFVRPSAAVVAVFIEAVAAILPAATPAAVAHETDQYTVPPNREFADLGGPVTRWMYRHLDAGVKQVNDQIRHATWRGESPQQLESIRSQWNVAHALHDQFIWSDMLIDELEREFSQEAYGPQFPGRVIEYKHPTRNIMEHAHFKVDPRQFFRIWLSPTVRFGPHYIGWDKIGHFTGTGMAYYEAYVAARKRGASEDDAMRAAIYVGTDDFFYGEKYMNGLVTCGDYANGDLVANLMGFWFYRNLTEPAPLKGQRRPPLLVADGPYWKLAPHVRPDSDFFAWYVCDNMDEALNPGFYEPAMREALRSSIRARASNVLEHYRDEHGCRRPQAWFVAKHAEMATYYGASYGHAGRPEDFVSVANTCFDPPPPGADPGWRNRFGETALHWAATRGDVAAVRELLARGADANAVLRSNEPSNAQWGDTPLHAAAAAGRSDAICLLLDAGARVGANNDRGVTPLHRAVRYPEVVALLIDRGADVTVADARGRTPLHWAAEDQADCRRTAAIVLAHGALPNAPDHDGRCPLHLAVASGNNAMTEWLLERGRAEVDAPDHFHETPLHLACGRGDERAVSILGAAGARADAADDFGLTPAQLSQRRGREAIARLLNLRTPVQPPAVTAGAKIPPAPRSEVRDRAGERRAQDRE